MIQMYKHCTMARLFLPIVLLFLFYLFYLPSGYAGNGIGEKITFTGNYGYTIIGNTENTGEAANECGEVNGTSRYLNIPSGATVHKAYLYWSGSSYYASNAVYIDQSVTLNSQNVAADDAWTETINNGGYYQDFYAAYADVTSKITGSGNITIDNLSFDKVVSCPYGSVYGGWSLVVIYTKSDLPNRTIKMYDGFYGYWPNPIKNFYQQWDLDGFTIPNCQANIELSSIIWEGDNYKGEKTYIDGQYMGDNLLSGSNSFNGSSNYNLDIDRYYLDDILSPGQTDFVYRVESDQVGNAWEFHLDNVFILQYDNCENTCKPTVKFTNSDCSSVTVKKGTTTVATITGGGFWNGDASDGDVFDFYLSTNKFDSYTVAGCSAQNYTVHPGGCSNYTCPESLVVNPSFENTIQGWTVVGDYNFTTHYAVNGNYVVFIKPSTQGQTATISQNVNVTTGTVYSLDFFAGTHEPSFNHTLSIEFYTQAGTLLGSQSVQVDHDVDPNQDLKAYNLTMTAPQGSRYVKIIGRASGDYLKLDALCLTGNPCDATDLICEYNTGSGWTTDDDCVVNVCSGSSLSLSVNPNGMSSYTWSGPNGFSGTGDKDGNILISNAITTAFNGVYSVTAADNKGCTSTKSITVNVSNLALNIAAYNVDCAGGNDGSLDLTVTGGIAPLAYSWSNGATTEDISGLSPGDYAVTVTDAAGCSATKKATISQPAKIDAWTEYTDVTCGGGSDGTITLYVIGGITPYQYLWSNGATTKNLSGLSTGDYAVTITDANGCTKAIKRWIDQPDKIDATLSVTNTGCQGASSGAINLSVTGGITPYSYKWSNGATTKDISNLSGGSYAVTITDNNGCTLVKSASVLSSGGPLVNIACSSDPLESRSVSNSHQSCGSYVTYGFWNDNIVDAYSNSPYWSVQSGSFKEYDNGTAYLEMVIVNSGNSRVSFNIKTVFKGRTFSPPTDSPKENTQCVGNLNNQDWYYYAETHGYAIGGGDISGALLEFDRNGPAFQVGTGANLNTSTAFGASGWLNIKILSQPSSGPGLNSSALHGDFNLNLSGSSLSQDPQCLLICAGNSVVLTASANAGTAPYSYSWSNGSHAASIMVSPNTTTTYRVTVTDAGGCSTTDEATVTVSESMQATIITQDISCNGANDGSIDLTVTAGTGPFTYLWSNGATTEDISGLQAGDYSVTITDEAGCQLEKQASISEPASLSLAIQTSPESCTGNGDGEVNLTVTGGTTPYHYIWSNGATTEDLTGVSAGSYSVTVTDAKNCSASDNVNIGASEPLVLTLIPVQATCAENQDGSVDLQVQGGQTPYKFSWSNGATTEDLTGLGAGTYAVTVTDENGCFEVAETQIIAPEPLEISLIASPTTCASGADGSITMQVSGGSSPYAYQWSNGATTQNITGLNAGNYSVTVTDANGCIATESATVISPDGLNIGMVTTDATCFENQDGAINCTVTGGTMPYSFYWNTGATTQNLTNLPAGNYSETVTDAGGCQVEGIATIGAPSALDLNILTVPETCDGNGDGIVNLTVTGGTAPYTYAWNTGATTEDLTGQSAGDYSVTVTDANGCTASRNATITSTEPLVLALVPNQATCADYSDGSINLQVQGGKSPYKYQWSNGGTTQNLSGLGAGLYSVTVTDANGCYAIESAEILAPEPLDLLLNSTPVTCAAADDGTITLQVSGGTQPYAYAWSNGATTQNLSGLNAGVYTVTVTDANGCNSTDNAQVTSPEVLDLNLVASPTSCSDQEDGTINATATGGTTPYSYLWNNGSTTRDLSGLGAGTYTLTVTDASGCSISGSATVNAPESIQIDLVTNPALCNGQANGSIDATVSGGISPYTYSWSNGATTQDLSGVVAGNYSVTVTDVNGCQATAQTSVGEPGPITLTLASEEPLCYGDQNGSVDLTVSGGTSPYVYRWSNGATSEDLTGVGAGSYTVTVTDNNGCIASESVILVTPDTLTISVSHVNANCDAANGEATADPVGGTAPYVYSWSNGATTAHITGLSSGNYSVTVTDAHGCSAAEDVFINGFSDLAASASPTDASCQGSDDGSVDLTVTGNSTGLSYRWSNGATTEDLTGVPAGTYSVTVTDVFGCTAEASAIIGNKTSIQVSAIPQAVDCHGEASGSIDLIIQGGVSPYSYNWSNGATTKNLSGLTAGTYSVTVTDLNGCYAETNTRIDEPEQLDLNLNTADVSCNGNNDGLIQTTITGGTTPYHFAWSNGATTQDLSGVGGGTYSVTVTDANGCFVSASATIDEPSALTLLLQATDVKCNGEAGGSINTTVSKGEAPYTYLWSNGATTSSISNLPAGQYSVTVTDAGGCQASESVNVDQPEILDVQLQPQDLSCFESEDGVIQSTVQGGAAPYTFVWNNGATSSQLQDLAAGDYSVTVTDANGCLAIANVSLQQPQKITLDLVSTALDCFGDQDGTINLSVSGGTEPYTYQWSNGATTEDMENIAAGNYSVTVTDANGCTAVGSKGLSQPDSLYVNLSHVDANCDASNGQATAVPGGGTSPYTYLWSSGQTTQSISSLVAGNYEVTVTDAHGCMVTGYTFINGKSDIAATAIATDATCAGVNDGSVDLTVTGSTSALTYKWNNGATSEDLTNVTPGTYSVTVTDAYGCTAEAKATVKSHSTITIAAIPTAADCHGSADGTIDLIIQGAVSPIKYLWSNGATTKNLTGLVAGVYSVTVTDANGCPAEAVTTIEEPEIIDVTISKTDISCDGSDGTITVSVTGGTQPYSYTWSNGATTQNLSGLQPGSYSVTVTDKNKCLEVASATIEEGNGLLIDIKAKDALCNGSLDGSVTSEVHGGVSPYTYLWSNGATTSEIDGLGYGIYEVTITDVNGCSATGQAKVNIPDAINLDLVGSSTSCQGEDGRATVTATGGTVPYQYAWSNGGTTKTVQGLAAGEYSVTVTDANGCYASESIIIEPGSGVLTVDVFGGELNCEDASILLKVVPSTDVISYSWTGPGGFSSESKEPEVNIPGTYSVTVTDANGCSGTGSAEVTSNVDVPEVQVSGENLSCLVSEVQLIAVSSIAEVEYSWFGPDGFTSSEQNPVVTKAGKYNVMVTTPQGCIGQGGIEIKVDQAGPEIELNAPDFGCGSSQVQIEMSVNEPNVEILWIGPGGFVSTEEDPVIDIPGTYHVTVTGASGCTTQDEITVGTKGDFELELSADTITCPHPAVTIEVFSLYEISSYTWTGPDGYSSNRPTPLVDVPGVYTLVAFSVNGCLDTATVEVIEDTFEPEVQAEGGIITCELGYIKLYGHSSTPDVTYVWSGPEGFSTTDPNPEVSIAGEYMLTVTGANGCKVITFVNVTKEPCGKIGDKVWLDGDCDGMQDSTEIGVDSILVTLYTCDSILVAQTYSDSNGMYYFDNLVPDRAYFVAVDSLPSKFTFAPHIDSIPDSLDTNIILFSSRTECFYVTPNMVDTTIDIGLCLNDTCLLNVQAEEYVIGCGMDSVQLVPKVNESGLRYHWESTNGFVSDEDRPWVFEPGKYYVTATDAYGCAAIACIVVTVSNTVDIEVIGGTVPCDGTGTQIYAYSADTNVIYSWVGPNGFHSLEQNPLVFEPGLYWVTVRDTIYGCYDKMMIEVFLECCNVTDGGILAGDEIACGPYDPLPIISVAEPTGGRGDIQYMWIKTTDPTLPFSLWTMIWDAHGPEYDPGVITETTYYSRCSKRSYCDEWIGESNIVVKRVIELPVVDTVFIGSHATCGENTGEIIIELKSGDSGPFMVRLIVDGIEKIFGPYYDRRIIIDGLAPGNYTSIQISNGFGCFSEVLEINLEIRWIACSGTDDAVDQISIHPNPASNYVQISAKLIENGDDAIQIELINLTGTIMKRINKTVDYSSDQLFRDRIDVHDIQAGMYYLRIRHGTEMKFIPVEILK